MPYIVSYGIISVIGGLRTFNSSEKLRKRGLLLAWITLSLLFGLRGYSPVLPDTLGYKWSYNYLGTIGFSRMVMENSNDVVYYGLNWIFSHLGIPWQIYLIMFSMFTMYVVIKWCSEYSDMPFLSIMIFMVFLFPAWESAMRQGLAMCFVYLGYIALDKRKIKKGIALYILSFFCHQTVIFFAPFFFIRKIRITDKAIAIYLISTVALYALSTRVWSIINTVAGFLGRNQYGEFWHERPTHFLAFIMLLLITALVFFRRDYNEDPKTAECIHAMFWSVMLLAFGGGTNLRLCYYYAIFACILIPRILTHIKPVQMSKVIVGLAFFALFLMTVDPTYYFYWQEAVGVYGG